MPPETKPVISSLAEMTCENCVYSAWKVLLRDETEELQCFYLSDMYQTCTQIGQFCSKGKWQVNDATYQWPTKYDDCYYLFGR